jgi:hypothetical protein
VSQSFVSVSCCSGICRSTSASSGIPTKRLGVIQHACCGFENEACLPKNRLIMDCGRWLVGV